MTSRRNIDPKRYILVEFGAQLIGTSVMIALAAVTHSVAALAIGWFVGGIAFSWLSFRGDSGPKNRLEWDPEAARAILQFGRWTACSSTLTVLQLQGDRMFLGKLFSVADLGIYSIGANLAMPPLALFSKINGQIAMPTYARMRDLPIDVARSKIRRLRLGIVTSLWCVFALIVFCAQPLVDFCYPPAFEPAGWYCALVAIGMMFRVATDLGPIFLAHGDARMHFLLTLLQAGTLVAAMTVGFFVGRAWGQSAGGVLYGIVFAPLVYYPVQAACYRRIHAWLPEVDLPAIAATVGLFVAWHMFVQ